MLFRSAEELHQRLSKLFLSHWAVLLKKEAHGVLKLVFTHILRVSLHPESVRHVGRRLHAFAPEEANP